MGRDGADDHAGSPRPGSASPASEATTAGTGRGLPRLAGSARALQQKWQRHSDLPLSGQFNRARKLILDTVRARLYLRDAQLGAGVRVVGRPRLVNHGTLVIGDDCTLRSIVAPIELSVGPGATMTLGKSVRLNSGDTFTSLSRIEIGDRVEIGPHVTIQDNPLHDLYDRGRVPESQPVVIEDDVWLASRCTISAGVRVGRGAVVVAHSLVTQDVAPFTIVSGVPAEPVARLNPKKFVTGGEG